MRLSLVLLWLGAAAACGPGRGFTRRHGPRRITPLVFNQHDPNIGENSKSASGPPEGRITRDDEKFRDLVPNYNPDIDFRDDEGTGADRLMTQPVFEMNVGRNVDPSLPVVKISSLDLAAIEQVVCANGERLRLLASRHNEGS
ncbi:Sonic hedgehog protein [Papilio machaon]|uniref:Sonic hedgehog protein n=1 Tax=Papilio machaon TaxID=76193 RepID=A0A0N1IF91_PAPMA|nr:Sonic hedgehog protein [Papilio machaon]